jgi:hypothetical protein
MKNIQFQYCKTPESHTDRKAIVLSKPNNNYFTLDITQMSNQEREKLEAGLVELQKGIDDAFTIRTKWLRDNGFGSCYRNFNKDKMSFIL